MLLDLWENAQAASWTCGLVLSMKCNERMFLPGQWFLFLKGSWPVNLEGFLACKSRYETMSVLPIFPVTHICFLSVCTSLPPPCYSLSVLQWSHSGGTVQGRWDGYCDNSREWRPDWLCVCERQIARSYSMIFIVKWILCGIISLMVDIVCSFSRYNKM